MNSHSIFGIVFKINEISSGQFPHSTGGYFSLVDLSIHPTEVGKSASKFAKDECILSSFTSDCKPSCYDRLYKDLEDKFPKLTKDKKSKRFELVFLESNGDIILLENWKDLHNFLYLHKERCVVDVPIPLSIMEWPPKSVTDIRTTAAAAGIAQRLNYCSECSLNITDYVFKCFQCENYILCGHCASSGKHPQHIVICSFGSKGND